jgi:hypothetical protein
VFRREYRFRRSWVAIAVLLVMDAVFLFPAFSTSRELLSFSDGIDSLFDLVSVLFLGAWLMGWMMAPLALTGIVILMLFGREAVRLAPATMEIGIGLPFVELTTSYDLDRLRNLRLAQPPPKSARAWRGPHFEFDYAGDSVAFGSDTGLQDLGELESAIKSVSGRTPREGEAAPRVPEEQGAEETRDMVDPVSVAPGAESPPEGWLTFSVLALVVANLIPVAGAAFLGWELSDVMVLYWAESAVIGLFNIAKIAVIGRWAALFAGPFFAGHFGAFMAVHFLFVYTIFVEGFRGSGPSGNLSEVLSLFVGLWPALLALVVSHGYSFFVNFLGKKEYRAKTMRTQMTEPYSRIVFMHMVLIFGGGLAMALGEPTLVILGVIALKIILDVKAHVKQRRSAGPGGAG